MTLAEGLRSQPQGSSSDASLASAKQAPLSAAVSPPSGAQSFSSSSSASASHTLTYAQHEAEQESDFLCEAITTCGKGMLNSFYYGTLGAIADIPKGLKHEWEATGKFFKDWTVGIQTGKELNWCNSQAFRDLGKKLDDSASVLEDESSVSKENSSESEEKVLTDPLSIKNHWSEKSGFKKAENFFKGLFTILTNFFIFKPLQYTLCAVGSILGGLFYHEEGKKWGQEKSEIVGKFFAKAALKLTTMVFNRALALGEHIVRSLAVPFRDLGALFTKKYYESFWEELSKKGNQPVDAGKKPQEPHWSTSKRAQQIAFFMSTVFIKNTFKFVSKVVVEYPARLVFGLVYGLKGLKSVREGHELAEKCGKKFVKEATWLTNSLFEGVGALVEHIGETAVHFAWTDGAKQIRKAFVKVYEAGKRGFQRLDQGNKYNDWRDHCVAQATATITSGIGQAVIAIPVWAFKLTTTALIGTLGSIGGFEAKDKAQKIGKEFGDKFWNGLCLFGNEAGDRVAALVDVGAKAIPGTLIDTFKSPEQLADGVIAGGANEGGVSAEQTKSPFRKTLDFIINGYAKNETPQTPADQESVVSQEAVGQPPDSVDAEDSKIDKWMKNIDSCLRLFANRLKDFSRAVFRSIGMFVLGFSAYLLKLSFKTIGGVGGGLILGVKGGRDGMKLGNDAGDELLRGARWLSDGIARGATWALTHPFVAAFSLLKHVGYDVIWKGIGDTFRDFGEIVDKSRNEWPRAQQTKYSYTYKNREGKELYRDAAGKLTTEAMNAGVPNTPETHSDWKDSVTAQQISVFFRSAGSIAAKIVEKVFEGTFRITIGSLVSLAGFEKSERFNKGITDTGTKLWKGICWVGAQFSERIISTLEIPRDAAVEFGESWRKVAVRFQEIKAEWKQIGAINTSTPDKYGHKLNVQDKRIDDQDNIVSDWKYNVHVQHGSLVARSVVKLVLAPFQTMIIGWPLRAIGGLLGSIIGGFEGKEKGLRIAKAMSNACWDGCCAVGRGLVSHPTAILENFVEIFTRPFRAKEGAVGWAGEDRNTVVKLWDFLLSKDQAAKGAAEVSAGAAEAPGDAQRWTEDAWAKKAASGIKKCCRATSGIVFVPVSYALSVAGGFVGAVLWGFKGKAEGQKLGIEAGLVLWKGTCLAAYWTGRAIVELADHFKEIGSALVKTIRFIKTEAEKVPSHYTSIHASNVKDWNDANRQDGDDAKITRMEMTMRIAEKVITEIVKFIPSLVCHTLKNVVMGVGSVLGALFAGKAGKDEMFKWSQQAGETLWSGTCWVGKNVLGNRAFAVMRLVQDAYVGVETDVTRGVEHVKKAISADRPLGWHAFNAVGSIFSLGFILTKYVCSAPLGLIGAISAGKTGKKAGFLLGETIAYYALLRFFGKLVNWVSTKAYGELSEGEDSKQVNLGVGGLRTEVHHRLNVETAATAIIVHLRRPEDEHNRTDIWNEEIPEKLHEEILARYEKLKAELA